MSLGVLAGFGYDMISSAFTVLSPPAPRSPTPIVSPPLVAFCLQASHAPISHESLYFNQNVKLLFKLSFVYFCEESRVALVFYKYFVVLFSPGHAASCGSGDV